jgi:hypothetical protein
LLRLLLVVRGKCGDDGAGKPFKVARGEVAHLPVPAEFLKLGGERLCAFLDHLVHKRMPTTRQGLLEGISH